MLTRHIIAYAIMGLLLAAATVWPIYSARRRRRRPRHERIDIRGNHEG